MKTLIRVKQEHIAEAKRRMLSTQGFSKSKNCPIALALKEHFKSDEITVGKTSFIVNSYAAKDLPRSCRRFIARFDNNRLVEPFNFFFISK